MKNYFAIIFGISMCIIGCEQEVKRTVPLSVKAKIGNRSCIVYIIEISNTYDMRVLECDNQIYPAAQELYTHTTTNGKQTQTITDVVDTVVLPITSASPATSSNSQQNKKLDKNCKQVDDNYILCKVTK